MGEGSAAPAGARVSAEGSVTPPAVNTLILFTNSRRIGTRPDLLADPATAGRALARAGLIAPGAVPTPAQRHRLIALRAALNAVLGGDDSAWAAIDREAARLRLRLAISAPGPTEPRPTAPGADSGGPTVELLSATEGDPVAAVLLNLYQAVMHGWWSRIRLCANEVCAVAFYDATRSRTQRWHSYARCGNRANVAAHRARTAAQ